MNQHDQSYGVIPLSYREDHWEVFLIQHRHGYHWGFPKGHSESNETPEEAARRELKEETNLEVVRFLQMDPLSEQYQFVLDKHRVFKRVLYFVAEVKGEIALQKKEIANGIWLPITKAFEQLTHQEGRSILSQVEKILAKI
jgi:bis(5'-nucleosidyl)-tetraphosphatase